MRTRVGIQGRDPARRDWGEHFTRCELAHLVLSTGAGIQDLQNAPVRPVPGVWRALEWRGQSAVCRPVARLRTAGEGLLHRAQRPACGCVPVRGAPGPRPRQGHPHPRGLR